LTKFHFLKKDCCMELVGCSVPAYDVPEHIEEVRRYIQKFPDWVYNETNSSSNNNNNNNNYKRSLRRSTKSMAAKLTRLTHKIEVQLHPVAESCTTCSSRSRRPVRKLLVTPSYIFVAYQKLFTSGSQVIPHFYGTRRFITMSTTVFPSTPRSSESSLPFMSSNQNFVCIFHVSHEGYIPRSFHLPWFDHPNDIWLSVQVKKLIIMQLSASPC
jgi:hypothetical protein